MDEAQDILQLDNGEGIQICLKESYEGLPNRLSLCVSPWNKILFVE